MALGSDESGEDMVSGRVNRAENTTRIWAQRKKDGHFADLDDDGPDLGNAILIVESAGNIEDKQFKQVLDTQHVHGIMSSGCGDGAGVVGFSRMHPIFGPGQELSDKDIEHTNSVGVFGKGVTGIVGQGDARGQTGIPHLPHQTVDFGAGVVGRGGEGLLSTSGVVGFAGRIEADDEYGHSVGAGVFGQGFIGVAGMGADGPGVKGTGGGREPGVLGEGHDGVHGHGFKGRGSVFEADQVAQVQLVPNKVQEAERPTSGSITPTFPELPKAGHLGDLMSVLDSSGQCTLWLCVSQDASGTARWARVLLGDLFEGTT